MSANTPGSLDPPRADVAIHVDLGTEPLDVAAALKRAEHPEAGGIGLFIGTVRNHHEGDPVDHLEYEAWDDQALPAMRTVAEAVVARFPGVRAVVVEHRLGRLEIGDASVVCVASAPHRAEAIAAATALIDDVKEQVPIWKRESLADGTTRWPGC